MTIEERADAYVGHPEEIDEFTSATIKRGAYIRGAKDQKAIDIDKACKWMNYNLHLFVMKGHINHSALEQEFRKAMEE